MEAVSISRSIVINAPRAQVWAALTEPEQMVRWLVPNLPQAEMKRDAAGHVQIFMMPEMGVDFVQFDILAPQRSAQLRGLPDDLLKVTFELADEGAGTRVTAALSGFEHLPAPARADRQAQSSAAWDQSLQNLQAYVAGAALPFPTAYVSPLFGYWRAPQQALAIERSIWIKAPIKRVWQALVDPVQFQAWFSPNTPWVLTELKVGGRMYVVNPETKAEMYVSVIELLDPPVEIGMRHLPHEYSESEKHTHYRLADENGGTRLTLTYTGYEHDAEATRWPSMEQTTFGYGMMLGNLKAHIEGNPLPFPGGF